MDIRESTTGDLAALLAVHEAAFGPGEGKIISALVQDIFADPSAQPLVSLVAVAEEAVLGHILFSAAHLSAGEDAAGTGEFPPAALLAPLAVTPAAQKRGIGSALIAAGLQRLAADGIGVVFVLGYPAYYSRHGFTPAGRQGFEAPYPIAPENAEAWMVQTLNPGTAQPSPGRVQCCTALDKAEYWRE